MKLVLKLGAITLLLLMIAAICAGVWYLRSDRFQDWARAQAISELAKATGLECSVQSSHIGVFSGTFHLSSLTLQSPATAKSPVQIAVDELSGELRIDSIFRRQLHLAKLDVVRPHIILVGGQEASEWNAEEFLPTFRKSLEFAVGNLRLSDGWIQINNRKVPFDASLNHLTCELAYITAGPAYNVHIAYENGRLDWAGESFAYDLDVRAGISLEGIDVQSLGLRYSKTHLSGEGWMRNWREPTILLHSSGTVAASDLSVFDRHLADAAGNIAVASNFRWDSAGFRSTARFSCASGSYHDVQLASTHGVMNLDKGVLVLRDVEGKLRGEQFAAEAEFHLTSGDRSPHQFRISFNKTPLKDAAAIIGMPAIAFENVVSGNVNLTWKHGSGDLDARCNLTLEGPPAATTGKSTALRGNASFRYAAGVWHLPSVELNSPSTSLVALSSSTSVFRLQLRTSDAGEIFGILRGFSSTIRNTLETHPDLMDLSGTYELTGDVRIDSAGESAYQGAVRITGGKWRKYSLDSLSARTSWDGHELDLQSFSAQRGAARASGNLHLTLADEPGSPPHIRFKGTLQQVNLTALKEFGIDYGEELSGTLSGIGSVSGAGTTWQGDVQFVLEKGNFRGQAFDNVRARVQVKDDLLRIYDGQLALGNAKLGIQGQIRMDSRQMDLDVKLAEFQISSLPAVRTSAIDVAGRFSGTGRLTGTLDNPAFAGKLDLDGLRYASWDLGRGKGTVDLKNRELQCDASVTSGLGSFGFHANISTEANYPGKATLELRDWNLQKLVAKETPPYLNDLSTALQGRVEIEGSFADPASLNYRGEVDGARFKLHEYELANSGKIRFSVAKKNLHVDQATIVGDGTDLTLSGDIPLGDKSGLDLRLDGNLNLKLLEQLQKKLQVSGSANLNVRATGAPTKPQIIGQAAVKNARVEYSDLPFLVSGLQGRIVFSRNLVRFEDLEGTMSGGSVQANGTIEHDTERVRSINMKLAARRARIQYPKDFRSTVDADLDLRGGTDSQVLSGEVRVIRGEYLRNYSLLEQLAGRGSTAPGPLTSDPFLVGLRLNVGIMSDEGLYVDNELAKLRGGMHLTLRGTPAYPSLTGRIEADDGSIFFRGNRFDIVRGSADFVDRNRINPQIEVRAEADVRSYRLILDVTGDLDHLKFNVSSDPPMSTVDILTLLTTGKESVPGTDTTRRQAEITGLSAASILSENLTGVLGKRVERLFGLQTFRVDPFLAGAENDPSARVTISERLTKDLNVTFSRNLSTNEEQIIIVEYLVNKNLSVVGTRDENGDFGLDFRFRKRFR